MTRRVLSCCVLVLSIVPAWPQEASGKDSAEPEPKPIYSAVTVTATLGREQDAAESPNVTIVRDAADVRSRPMQTLGEALDGAPGILVQKTSTSQVSPFLRGLTGYQVLNLIDGIRFNNSTFRSGPNQYLAFVEPAQARHIEAVLGPAGSLYGSDAMGGAIQVLTLEPAFASNAPREWHGDFSLFGGTADLSGGATAQLSVGTARVAWLLGGAARRHNDLRGGDGADSRHVLRRLFGLEDDAIRSLTGSRMTDTAFSQRSGHTKLALRTDETQSLTAWYQFNEQSGTDGYKDLWGGLGRMQSKFEPQQLQFAYVRYQKLKVGGLDQVSGTFSINSQGDGTVRQGLRATDIVVTDRSRVNALGYAGQAAKQWGRGPLVTFGSDLYDEHVNASRLNGAAAARPLYPDGARYRTFGLYSQGMQELFSRRLRATAGMRFTRVSFQTLNNPAFGVPGSGQSFQDTTFNGSLTWRAAGWLDLHAAGGRGFRAPNLNDLGAIGLNDLGYEIPASEASGALMGNNAGESAAPSGRSVAGMRAESLWNAEAGFVIRARRMHARASVFQSDLVDPIVRRTLLFPVDAAPVSLAGIPVRAIEPTAAQRAAGVTMVATDFDSRGVKAFVNDGQTRYSGVESLLRFEPSRLWRVEAGYSFMGGRDLYPNRNVRRLPPQNGYAAVRWLGGQGRPWIELRADAAGAQRRLSGGDLDDERIGASRSRADIASFFNGSRMAAYRTADGRFAPTGETLAMIQDRVLPRAVAPLDSTRVPLYRSTAGWVSLGVRSGVPLGERLTLQLALENLADRSYRTHGSGVDAAGLNAWAGVRWSF